MAVNKALYIIRRYKDDTIGGMAYGAMRIPNTVLSSTPYQSTKIRYVHTNVIFKIIYTTGK